MNLPTWIKSVLAMLTPAHPAVTSRVLMTIRGVDIHLESTGRVWYVAGLAVDSDGCGASHGDPDWQNDTSLHLAGKPLDADVDPYIVLPPVVIRAVPGVVLGCQARVTNTRNGRKTDAVVGDVGPGRTMATAKIGEASVELARRLGVNPSPVNGGEGDHVFLYECWPGTPGFVDDTAYRLQPV